jgi:choline dehydrogenase-like flavoprotein
LLCSVRGTVSNAPSDPVISNDQAREMYYANRTGPWTVSGPTNFAFIPLNKVTDKSKEILDALSSQDAATFLPSGAHPSVVAGWDAQRKILAKHLSTDTMGASEIVQLAGLAAPGPGHLVSFQHPFSRGYVAIKSADPFEYPTIDLRYSTNPLDWNVTIETLRFTRKLMAVSPMAETKYLELVPGIQLTTDAQLQTYFASRLSTMFHSCCTNPMQPLARGGVVDAKLKVYGVANLRYAHLESPCRSKLLIKEQDCGRQYHSPHSSHAYTKQRLCDWREGG